MTVSAPPVSAPPRLSWSAVGGVRAGGLVLGVAAAYAAAYALGVGVSGVEIGPTLFWLPAGVALAAVVRFGWPAVAGLALGALALTPAVGYPVKVWAAIASGPAAGGAVGGWLIRRRGRDRLRLDGAGDIVLLLAAAVAGAGVAVVGPIVLWARVLGADEVTVAAAMWWTGHAGGVLLVAPALLGAAGRRAVEWSRVATGLAAAGLVAAAAVAVAFAAAWGWRLSAPVACLPMVAIAAVRFGPRGAAAANLFTAGLVFGMALSGGRGDFTLGSAVILAVSAFTALCLGAITAERDAVHAQLTADIAARIAAETERNRAEAARVADRARFATLLEHSHDAIAVLTPDGRTEFMSEAITRLTGRTPAALVGRPTFENLHPDDLPAVRAAFAECLAGPGLPVRAEFRVRAADARWVWLESIGTNHLGDPAVGGVVVNIRDVTGRREAEDRLREARALLEATGRLARIGGWEYVIPDDRLTWSEQTFRIHELDPAAFTPTVAAAIDFYAPEARPTIRAAVDRAVRTGEPWNLVLPFVTAAGNRLWVSTTGQVERRAGRPDRLFGTFQDVTEQKKLEDQLRQSQKLEAVARLAGGVAHDFNNLLTVINGFADLIAAEVEPGSPIAPLAAHITEAGKRAADLTRQLLAFSRKQPPAATLLDLVAVVNGLRPLLAPLVGDNVRLVLRLAPVPPVLADRGQFESVVMNLAVNARDAMAAVGTLTIETGVADDPPDLPPGRWVALAVTDTGTGIPEEVRPHLFEPFFTTKGIGKGTGLGLPSVYGIVTTAGGHVRYDTVVGRGTTFRAYLPVTGESGPRPAAAGGPAAGHAEVAAAAGRWPAGGRAPRILLVEDQPAVRELLTRVLADAGFAVTPAADGPAALDRLAESPDGPDVLVTDLVMPELGGRELADRVREQYPGVRVLFVSGYNPEEAGPDTRTGETFLPKPFGTDALLRAVRGLIGRPG